MQHIFHQYYFWEDYKNGMYEIPNKNEIDFYVEKSFSLLTDLDLFYKIANEVIINWQISAENNLTNMGCNRYAWIGQSSCSYLYKSPEYCTRIAWGQMSILEQNKANAIAHKIIINFEKYHEAKNKKIHKGLGEQMLLQWNT